MDENLIKQKQCARISRPLSLKYHHQKKTKIKAERLGDLYGPSPNVINQKSSRWYLKEPEKGNEKRSRNHRHNFLHYCSSLSGRVFRYVTLKWLP